MVISCAAVNCTNRQGKVDKAEISFHRFPMNNAGRLAKWEQAVRRENWMPNRYSFLCSRHFAPDCFKLRHKDQQRQLKDSAVPTIFDFTRKDRVSGGNLRKKLVSVGGAGVKEEEVAQCKRSITAESVGKKIWVFPELVGPPSEVGESSAPPPQVGPHQPTGEWSLGVAGGQEVFTPSSCSLIDALHSYSSVSRQERGRRGCASPKMAAPEACISHLLAATPGRRFHPKTKQEHLGFRRRKQAIQRHQLRRRARCLHAVLYVRKRRRLQEVTAAPLNPAVLALDWLLGSWESDEPGEGSFPTVPPFRYSETLLFTHVGQPVINFMFNAFHAESKKPLHRECGFIRLQPGTNRVAFIIAQNSGVVEIEEGELTSQQLTLQTHALARTSFAREPHVQQISRLFQLRSDGRLEQTVSMATGDHPLTQHLHITYRRSS
ncbi:hypothetical protein AAFF_G00118660 [Aldrovandia affinis]|uniref:THAP-type domain-containing protein n=1 Tax=Aldrovandia affinis TaxID=143900 RepID=A0AAD7RSK5_9TELE|nr:hypothetical protein AAFF_G00118660 [Aldrovandia affinis]